jgi:hypothetical protein
LIRGNSRNAQLPVGGLGLRWALRISAFGVSRIALSRLIYRKKRRFTGHHRLRLLISPTNTQPYHPWSPSVLSMPDIYLTGSGTTPIQRSHTIRLSTVRIHITTRLSGAKRAHFFKPTAETWRLWTFDNDSAVIRPHLPPQPPACARKQDQGRDPWHSVCKNAEEQSSRIACRLSQPLLVSPIRTVLLPSGAYARPSKYSKHKGIWSMLKIFDCRKRPTGSKKDLEEY